MQLVLYRTQYAPADWSCRKADWGKCNNNNNNNNNNGLLALATLERALVSLFSIWHLALHHVCVQAAYKNWLCSSLLTAAIGDERSWQCRVYCDRVARLCPYLLPHVNASYAGEPAFSCTGMFDSQTPCSRSNVTLSRNGLTHSRLLWLLLQRHFFAYGFWKLIEIWRGYRHEFGGTFLGHGVVTAVRNCYFLICLKRIALSQHTEVGLAVIIRTQCKILIDNPICG